MILVWIEDSQEELRSEEVILFQAIIASYILKITPEVMRKRPFGKNAQISSVIFSGSKKIS